MKNPTHDIAKKMVVILNKKENYTNDEMIIMIYGLELILNVILKVAIYVILAILLGKSKETIIAIFFCNN